MKIAMIASEINPLVKTGGLADVVHALSVELKKKGNDVICVLPYYRVIASKPIRLSPVMDLTIKMGWRKQIADIHSACIDGVTYYVIGSGYYFDRPSIYGYDDDGERFAFFSLAAMALLNTLSFHPNIVHVHDWQTGMIPSIGKVLYSDAKCFASTRYVLTIHNPAFKGMLSRSSLGDLYNLPESFVSSGIADFGDGVSTLKCGIMAADKITTVSPTHREELLRFETAQGLDGVLKLRQHDFAGFVNGIDVEEFNPEKDNLLPCPYSVKNLRKGKNEARKELLRLANLPDNHGPLFGLVSRLTYQKGIDLILGCAREMLLSGGMLAVLGSGEYPLEQGFESLRREFPSQVALYIGYSDPRAHLIYAASDFFLMPSLFEPCGIGQMIAERYGSLPIARDTGGLHDTIVSWNGENDAEANGFLFRDYNVDGLRYGIGQAQRVYSDKTLLRRLCLNAMKTDHSWERSAELYAGLYRSIL